MYLEKSKQEVLQNKTKGVVPLLHTRLRAPVDFLSSTLLSRVHISHPWKFLSNLAFTRPWRCTFTRCPLGVLASLRDHMHAAMSRQIWPI
jgi:hypothetical protein